MNKFVFCIILFSGLIFLAIPNGVFGLGIYSNVTFPTGHLGKKWNFPSDHLPIGLTAGDIHLVSWNILDTKYIFHILNDQQGLKDSLIVSLNVPVKRGDSLTHREVLIIDHILEMIHHPHFPRSIIALQEVGGRFFEELKKRLPENMRCLTTFPNNLAHGDIFIYDSDQFESIQLRSNRYRVRPLNTYMSLILKQKKTGIVFNCIQSHIPAQLEASSEARAELAREVLSLFSPDHVTIVMGDMNRSPDFFLRDLEKTAIEMGLEEQPLKNLWIPYPTHIDCEKQATWIDNFFYYAPNPNISIEITPSPESFFSALAPTIELLKNRRPIKLNIAFEIWCKLHLNKMVIVHGGPGLASSEQLALALKGNRIRFFDLKEEFLDYYFKENQIQEHSHQTIIRTAYSDANHFHHLEYEWLENNFSRITDEFMSSEVEVVVFERLDLGTPPDLNTFKMSSLSIVSSIAQKLLEAGKKTVLITEGTLSSSVDFWKEIKSRLGMNPEDLVRPQYLSGEEEIYLLDYTNLSREEVQHYREWVSGIPSGYSMIIDFLAKNGSEEKFLDVDFDTLVHKALENIENQWKNLKKPEFQEVIELLQDIASRSPSEAPHDFKDEQIALLINTGLVTKKNGNLFMPNLVRDVISNNL